MEDSSATVVPGFLIKLWALVDDNVLDDVIRWSESGQSFCIMNQQIFAKKVLPKYFKHNNIASFTRQLNIYGFRKVSGTDHRKTVRKAPAMEFQHPFFKKGGANLIEHIKRKVSSVKVEDARIYSDELQKMMTDLQEMNDKQSNMDARFAKLKKQYATLWQEMKNLRQKYSEQQQLLTQFLQLILSFISDSHMENTNRERSLPAIFEASASKCARQYFHVPEERKEEAMEIIRHGYAIIDEKYKRLLDNDLPTLKNECKNLVPAVDQANGDCGKDPEMSSQDVPVNEDSLIMDLDLAKPDLQELMTLEPFGEEGTKDISLELESLLSQDIDSVLTEGESNAQCDTIMNRDEMQYIDGELAELKAFLSGKNVNDSSDHVAEPISSELPNLITTETEVSLNGHVAAEADCLSLMKNGEGEINLLEANGKEDKQVVPYQENTFLSSLDEILMSDLGERFQDSNDLLLDDLKNPSDVLPDLCDHDYVALNISSQPIMEPIENIMPHLCVETSEEGKVSPLPLS